MMPPSAVIVVLSRYPDIFARFKEAAEFYEPHARKIMVRSGDELPRAIPGWTVVDGVEPFIFARNANIGIRAAEPNAVLLINDDVTLLHPLLGKLEAIARQRPRIGVLSPMVRGDACNGLQKAYGCRKLTVSRAALAFVAVYIRRNVFKRIGMLDERFTGYGAEDRDFCRRAQVAGFDLAVTHEAVVKHGFGKETGTASFRRVLDPRASNREMRSTLAEKWGVNKWV